MEISVSTPELRKEGKMLTQDQKIEMMREYRRLLDLGRPENAVKYRRALDRGEYLSVEQAEAPATEEAPTATPPSKKAKVADWRAYAKEVSEMDHEFIDEATKSDLISALETDGLA